MKWGETTKVTTYNGSNLIGYSLESLSESIGTIIHNSQSPNCAACSCLDRLGSIDCGTCDQPPSICPYTIGLISPQAQAH